MKKLAVVLLAFVMVLACGILPACSSTPAEKEDILVWAADEVVEFTQTKCDEFLAANPDLAEKFTITVSAMGEGEAATQMITDVEAGADVFAFAQDQLGRLVQAGALSPLGGTYMTDAQANNDAGSVAAATMGDTMYAYPLTSDNGYFLFYDKSVVTDPSTLDGILTQCENAGKYFYMENQSGWYLVTFFFGAGCHYTTTANSEGAINTVDCDFNSAAGLGAFKALIAMAQNPGFQRSDSFAAQFNPDGGQAGAAISGTWDAANIKGYLGDNYGVSKLPTMTVDGQQVQMGAWGGFKLLGVNPTQSAEAVVASHKLAAYLTSGDVQLARYNAKGWGPSNKTAQQDSAVLADEALAALQAQLVYSPAQPQCSANYWTKMEAFGTDVNAGVYNDYTDAQLQTVLDDLVAYLKADVTQ
ncbi:MAG TPA: extracellular solute-binding protein [Oscillospiraceae bacterium]|nr:extracellular solute-binding protein [Oscillospiraceae bacterium]HPK35312.1 extracellular solute-binding protein [Oscillospiraceae bacterium]HPR76248.1 extracellular solute-binding protein [Oscillospiraceae bacterium]